MTSYILFPSSSDPEAPMLKVPLWLVQADEAEASLVCDCPLQDVNCRACALEQQIEREELRAGRGRR